MKKSIVLVAVFSLFLLPLIFAPISVNYIPNSGGTLTVAKVVQDGNVLAENNPEEATLKDNSEPFLLQIENLVPGTPFFVFDGPSGTSTLALKTSPTSSYSVEISALNFGGAQEKTLMVAQVVGADTFSDSIIIRVAGSSPPVAGQAGSVVEALALIDKKLVDGIFK
jgi:hypothetical protein